MSRTHFEHWPKGLPHDITAPATNLFYNAEVSADSLSEQAVRHLLRHRADLRTVQGRNRTSCRISCSAVRSGQRRPRAARHAEQSAIHRCLLCRVACERDRRAREPDERDERARSTTLLTAERKRQSSRRKCYPQMKPLIGAGLERVIVAAYGDYVKEPTDLKLPEAVAAPRQRIADSGVTLWTDALAKQSAVLDRSRPGSMISASFLTAPARRADRRAAC